MEIIVLKYEWVILLHLLPQDFLEIIEKSL